MPDTHEKQPDQQRIVATLAAQCQVPIGDMATLYEHERAELESAAQITKFIHVFATRNVQRILRERGVGQHPLALAEPALLAV